ncbi:TetR/AcrR family transcriptional regulator [Nonomuraea sp. NPDC046570]|uniref:TetR/AcrR family transcriptional regulator n=1 Tax=Nonomuraea sp. NPDC046570 TaxID=3155255 RepID=UPI0033FD5B11
MTAYQQAQQVGQSAVRATILDAATHLLVTDGPAALTVRRISAEVGCSTKVIYTMFGGKDGLVEALWLEGFARFERRLLEASGDPDPLYRLGDIGAAYRSYALAEPDYYRVMFHGVMRGFEPSACAKDTSRGSFGILVSVVQECLDQGRLRGAPAAEIADLIWMAVHGAVSLEISGFFGTAEAQERFNLLCSSVLSPFRPSQERTVPWLPHTEADSPRPPRRSPPST